MADISCFTNMSMGFVFGKAQILDDPREGFISTLDFNVGIDRFTAFFESPESLIEFATKHRVTVLDKRRKF